MGKACGPSRRPSLSTTLTKVSLYGPLTRYIKLRVAHGPGMPGTFFSPPRVSDPDMHHGTCVAHVAWCMPGSLTSGFLWSRWWWNVPGIPVACATRNFTYLVRGLLEQFYRRITFTYIEQHWILELNLFWKMAHLLKRLTVRFNIRNKTSPLYD